MLRLQCRWGSVVTCPKHSRGRRRGRPKPQHHTWLFANVTFLGKTAIDFLANSVYHALVVVETHQSSEDSARLAKRWRAHKWRSSWSPAVATGKGGTHGGAMVAVRSLIGSCPPASYQHDDGILAPSGDVVFRSIAAVHGDVLVGAIYFDDAVGIAGANLGKLGEVHARTCGGSRDFVLFGDFNIPPSAWAGSEWLTMMRAELVVPDVPFTCRNASGGSLIDYAIVSKRIRGFIEIRAKWDVPWSPHCGLEAVVHKQVRPVFVRTLVQPLSINQAFDREPGAEIPPIVESVWWDAYAQAIPESRRQCGEVAASCRGHATALGCETDADNLAFSYGTWSTAIDYAAWAAVGGHHDDPRRMRILGRGQCPAISIRRQMIAPSGNKDAPPSAGNLIAAWWKRLACLAKTRRAALLRGERGGDFLVTKATSGLLRLCRERNAENAIRELPMALRDRTRRRIEESATMCECDLADFSFWAVRQARRSECQAAARAKAEFVDWVVRNLASGASALHRYANAPNATPPPRPWVDAPGGDAGERSYHPQEVVQCQATSWAAIWNSRGGSHEESCEVIRRLRCEVIATDQNVIDTDPEKVSKALSSFSAGTSVGLDGWRPKELSGLPDGAIGVLARIANDVGKLVAWPLQVFSSLIVLLGKPGGDNRCIALTATLYRLVMRLLAGPVKHWNSNVALDVDSARAGASSGLAATDRMLSIEIARAEQHHVLCLLWDMWKFYDSILLPTLAQEAKFHGYPLLAFVLGAMVHVGPRFMVQSKAVALPITAFGNSILAGCMQSNGWARALLLRTISRLNARHPGSTIHPHVDDLSQVVIGHSASGVLEIAAPAALELIDHITNLGLKISGKSKVLPSGDPAAHALRAELLRETGITVQVCNAGNDLGIETTAGRRRAQRTIAQREAKSRIRCRRVGWLAMKHRKAAKLYTTGCKPQLYGCAAQGSAPTRLAQRARDAAQATGFGGKGLCRVTALALTAGVHNDPRVAAPIEQLMTWLQLWKRASVLRRRSITKCWFHTVWYLKLAKNRWQCVRGPLAATVATLMDLGARPTHPARWKFEAFSGAGSEKTFYFDLDSSTNAELRLKFWLQDYLVARLWAEAAVRFNGRGLEAGPPELGPLAKALHFFRNNGFHQEALALEHVAVNLLWTPDRLLAHGANGISAACRRCGHACDSPYHRFWECPDNEQIASTFVRETQWMRPHAAEGHLTDAVMWLRGIMPASWLPKAHEPGWDDLWVQEIGNFDHLLRQEAGAGSDGSCMGPSGAASVRTSGFAVAVVKDSGVPAGAHAVSDIDPACFAVIYGNVPGRQTAARGEAFAILQFVLQVPLGQAASLGVDASYGLAGIHGDRGRMLRNGNADIWDKVYSGLRDHDAAAPGGRHQLSFVKVKAHVSESALCEHGMSRRQLLENRAADAGSKRAVKENAASAHHEEADRNLAWAYHIARRIGAIQADHRRRFGTAQKDELILCLVEQSEALERRACALAAEPIVTKGLCQHTLVRQGRSVFCVRCRRRCGKGNHRYWRQHVCIQGADTGGSAEGSAMVPSIAELPSVPACGPASDGPGDACGKVPAEGAVGTPVSAEPMHVARRVGRKKHILRLKHRIAGLKEAIRKEKLRLSKGAWEALLAGLPTHYVDHGFPSGVGGAAPVGHPWAKVHSSHICFLQGGFAVCAVCGSYADCHPLKLRRRCAAPSASGSQALKAFAKGKLPAGARARQAWPDGTAACAAAWPRAWLQRRCNAS